jgi:FkbM family methyltransferase
MDQKLRRCARGAAYRLANFRRADPASYTYFGIRIAHAPGDLLVQRAVQEGVFESDVVKTLGTFLRPGSAYFDIGANLGLLAIPFLGQQGLQVHSFEPCPTVLQYLRETCRNAARPNWHLHEVALGAADGTADFHLGGAQEAAYAGLQATGRTTSSSQVTVQVRTLDSLWRELGHPPVSVIKIDVEGGEIDAFRGGMECIRSTRPAIIAEIDPLNFPNYTQTTESIFQFIEAMDYEIYQIPDYACQKPCYHRITSATELSVNLKVDINYLLLPRKQA